MNDKVTRLNGCLHVIKELLKEELDTDNYANASNLHEAIHHIHLVTSQYEVDGRPNAS